MEKVIGVCGITNNHGLVVYDVDYGIEDRLLVAIIPGSKKKTWCKIRHGEDGRGYIIKFGMVFYLDEIERVS